MGSKTSSQQNTNSSTQADPQAATDYTGVINRARRVSQTPYTPYSGQLTAPVNAQEQTATTAMNGLGAAANTYFGQAAMQSGLGAAAVNPTGLGAAAINKYMSPYQSDVINSTSALLNQQDQIQQQQQTGNAIGAGAFGGDRAGIAQAALAGQQDLANNSTLAGLENQNYAQALSEANTQQSVGLGAAQANRAALQQNAETLAGIGSASTSAGLGVAGAQLGAGALEQQTSQASDTAKYGQFLQQEAYPFQTEQYLASIVDGTAPNFGSTSMGTSTTQTNPLNSIIGGAAVAGALAPSLSGLGTGLSNIGSSIGGLFSLSDRRAKEDVRKAGALFDGLPIYTFRYKGSPVTELGLVAQDVEKKYPKAVRGLGGLKFLDYEEATRGATDKGHFAKGGRTLGEIRYRDLTREEVAHLDDPEPRATGGAVGPYSDVTGYVPAAGLGAAQMPSSPLPNPSQPTNPIPNFNQFSQAGQGLGAIGNGASSAATGVGNFASDLAAFTAPANGMGLPFGGHADGGRVKGLGALKGLHPSVHYDNGLGKGAYAAGGEVKGLGDLRLPEKGLGVLRPPRDYRGLGAARRGYDGGGVVTPDQMLFDPDALGTAGQVQPGLGAAVLPPATMAPPQSQGLGAVPPPTPPVGLGALPPPPSSQGLGAVPAPVAPAPSQGLGAAASNLPPPSPTGLGAAAQPQNGLGAIGAAAPASSDPLGGYMARVRTIESSGDDNASSGTAFGRYQFTPGTWSSVASRHPELGLTASGMGDPSQQDAAMRALTSDNAAELTRALGRSPTPQELYIAHQQGVVGAIGLLTNPNARASDIVGQSAITSNGGLPNMTAGQFTGMWASRFNGTGGVSGGMPASALGYAGSSDGLGAAALSPYAPQGSSPPPGLQPAVDAYYRTLSTDTSTPKNGLGAALGFGPGGDGGLFGISDDARMAIMSAGAGMMASPSKSPGIAIGQGVAQGIGTLQAQQKAQMERAKVQKDLAAAQSEAAYRQGDIGVRGKELEATLYNYRNTAAYMQAEAQARLSEAATNASRLNLERYEVLPGPDNDFRYFDKLNPSAGLKTAAQVTAEAGQPPAGGLPAPGGAPPAAGGSAPGGGAAPPAGAPQPAPAPVALDSSRFQTTGMPTLAAPHGYLPHGYYTTVLRAQNDPVMRDTLAKQTSGDVTEANDRAQKAYSSTFYSDEMDRNAAALPNSGLLVAGGAFPERLGLAKNWNAAMTGLGFDGLQVDPDAAKAGEALVKDKTRLGGQLTQQLGSREAAAVFGSMMSAVPGGDNTRAGYKAISSSIRVLAQRDIDRNAFYQDWAGRYGNTLGAEQAFNQLNPSMNYARQAQAIARIPQQATDILRANANDPRARAVFDKTYGAGLSRFFTGQFGQ